MTRGGIKKGEGKGTEMTKTGEEKGIETIKTGAAGMKEKIETGARRESRPALDETIKIGRRGGSEGGRLKTTMGGKRRRALPPRGIRGDTDLRREEKRG